MSRQRKFVKAAAVLAATSALAVTTVTQAETIQRGGIRLVLQGSFAPIKLPRQGSAPIAVSVASQISATKGKSPPQLRKITIAINRNGVLDAAGLPRCAVDEIQPATTEKARQACGDSLVGSGRFAAKVLIPSQAPFPSQGDVDVFYGSYEARPAILAHVYGTDPVPTSVTLPFTITRTRGTFGTVLSASLPQATGQWGYVTALQIKLDRRWRYSGKSHSFLSAGCPAPAGLTVAPFPLLEASYGFVGGRQLSETLVRHCTTAVPAV